MPKHSAGILLYRRGEEVEVFLVHPGGPFWARKDAGSWSIPKGEYVAGEEPLDAAKREFTEETGFSIDGACTALRPIRQAGGKIIEAWAVEGDCDAEAVRSNTFELEWPPHSGKRQVFPEVDRVGWFSIPGAREKILKSQEPLLDQLISLLRRSR